VIALQKNQKDGISEVVSVGDDGLLPRLAASRAPYILGCVEVSEKSALSVDPNRHTKPFEALKARITW